MVKIDYEQLEPSEDYLILLYNGKPFTGIAFEKAEEGYLLTETSFVDGQRSGVSKEWSLSGVLIREQNFKYDALHGQSREWHENGQLKTEGIYELGICLQEKEWSENGELIRDFVLDELSAQFKILKKLRASV